MLPLIMSLGNSALSYVLYTALINDNNILMQPTQYNISMENLMQDMLEFNYTTALKDYVLNYIMR